ncbi:MAG: sugar phosphate isomerase/epimerase [Ruminiclostridium sp.]|nr:sugar phosphate isomerase/epimerase [Ruminiclostridium sp.]
MFKKGVITDEISQDFGTAVELARKYKLDGVEIRSVWGKGPHELDRRDVAGIKEIVEDARLEVCGISAPFYKCDIDNPTELKEQIIILRKCIELAHNLGTGLIRGFTFWKKGSFEENLGKIVSRFEEPVKILEREGLTLMLEFDPSVYASNSQKLVKVVEEIGSPLIKALWDPGNDIYDPDGEVPFPDGYEIIKPYMVHMHLKDAVRQMDAKIVGVPLGEGQVNYKGQFRELIKTGYNGYVVLETHYRPIQEISEALLALPKGSAFSYKGYEATEECLIKWNELMGKL